MFGIYIFMIDNLVFLKGIYCGLLIFVFYCVWVRVSWVKKESRKEWKRISFVFRGR